MAVEAELRVALATVRVVELHLLRPVDDVMSATDAYWLDLSLTPRTPNARFSYRERWGANRFEKLGRLFVTPPGELIRARSDVGDQVSIVCQLHPQPLAEWFDAAPEWNDRQLEGGLDLASPTIQGLVRRLGEEARHPGFASEALGEAITAQIAIELTRHFSAMTEVPHSGGIAPWRLRLIDERLREAQGTTPTLAELAALCGLSVRQLTRGFRATRGCSIGTHIAHMRIEAAKAMLARGESVKAVAYAMRFASPSSFCYAFRKATGQAPRQFREGAVRRLH